MVTIEAIAVCISRYISPYIEVYGKMYREEGKMYREEGEVYREVRT